MVDPVKRQLADLRAAGAPEFFERNPAIIKAGLKAKFEAITNRPLYPSQAEMFLIETASYVLSLLAEAAQNGVLQNTVVFAEGRHLEDRAANVSTYRLLSQRATTTLTFQLAAVRQLDTIIPAGTRAGAGGAVAFATDASVTIPAGAVAGSVSATADQPGASWNGVGIGAVSDLLDPVAFVASVANSTDVTGGTDVEEQERFRLRVANALHTISKSGPRDGYREHVMAVNPEIVDVAPIRPEPGKIDIYPLMRTGLPSVELKAAILAYLDPETRRPMGDEVTVYSPTPVVINMTFTVRVSESVAGQQAAFEAAARAAFYPWSQELGCQIAPSLIIAALKAEPRVVDVTHAGFVFQDLTASQFATLGALVVNIVVAPNV